ncbi:MAG: ketoacyl-ACP synthase III [Holosporales bacterium]|jgi:3-oxoacyl-[acyl-carrier-protein] synthase-3|nr:ketoacyl-ACP synthase III [Holosporales bacterium]
MKTAISSIAGYLPSKIITNDDLSKTLDTTHEWIFDRTGIEQRHLVSDGEFASDLGIIAAKKALEQINFDPSNIDAIIVSTTTSDRRFPSCAARIQGELQANRAFAFDVAAACAGFIYTIAIADSMMKSRQLQNVLLVCCETLSLFVDWTDRSTCVLFGDGAGALLLNAAEDDSPSGLVATKLYTDGSPEKYNSILSHNGPQNDNRGYTTMMGRAVFKYAIENMSASMHEILTENNMTLNDIDWIIPHQANRRILESLCKMKNFPLEKMIITTQDHANTSSASIPLAMCRAIENGRIKKGQTILMTALGAGLVYGSAIIKY